VVAFTRRLCGLLTLSDVAGIIRALPDEQVNDLFEPTPSDRLEQHARDWRVIIDNTFETESSVIAFGARDVDGVGSRNQEVVLKVVKQLGDEWHSGEVLTAFKGKGFVRVYEHAPGAVLLQRLRPGNSLVELSLNGRDEEATDILAGVIQQMSSIESSMSSVDLPTSERESPNPRALLQYCPTVHDWAKAFERYIATGDKQIPMDLVMAGQRVYLDLCSSQQRPILLHGDLQHYNVLFDSDRGWLAIDPKGVFGEIEYEIGAALRNPFAQPELFLSRATIERRLGQFTSRLNLNYERTLAWGFAQSALSAIWRVEDGFTVDATNPALRLAAVMRPMLQT
jgi:streptomycin 6-kinase